MENLLRHFGAGVAFSLEEQSLVLDLEIDLFSFDTRQFSSEDEFFVGLKNVH